MIIVSQNRKVISNFENLIGIQIEEHIANADGEREYKLKTITENKTCNLGFYETERRAVEVLEELTNKYLEYAAVQSKNGRSTINAVMLPKAYIMPKE